MKCECPARDAEATAFHQGSPDGCNREADGSDTSSPALCLPCLYGCMP